MKTKVFGCAFAYFHHVFPNSFYSFFLNENIQIFTAFIHIGSMFFYSSFKFVLYAIIALCILSGSFIQESI